MTGNTIYNHKHIYTLECIQNYMMELFIFIIDI